MKLLSFDDLKALKGVPYSRNHVMRLCAEGKFPKPINIGPKRIAFLESEVDEWIGNKVATRKHKG